MPKPIQEMSLEEIKTFWAIWANMYRHGDMGRVSRRTLEIIEQMESERVALLAECEAALQGMKNLREFRGIEDLEHEQRLCDVIAKARSLEMQHA